jgi:protein O-mannosyl-transferase
MTESRRIKRPHTSPLPTSPPGPRRLDLAICLALILAIAIVYAPVRNFDFVGYDDPEYITTNRHLRAGLTLKSLKWAFTSGENANWLPLTRLSHLLDFRLFGLSAGPHHLINVLLHIVATLLLFAFLLRATHDRWPSAFTAFVFALHPLHVGSVAWVSERKDVLSAVFWFLTLWTWVYYAEARHTERPATRRYLLALAAFGLGLMAKPMLVTLPFVLLLVDLWPLRREFSPTLLLEKVPFLALSLLASVATFLVQQSGGAVKNIAFGLRVENALITWVVYIFKAVWPTRLAVFYPFPMNGLPLWQAIAAGIALAAVSALAIRSFPARPYFATGWFWYFGTLVPVIGLVQVGSQQRADRYMYIPLVGLSIILAWCARDLLKARPRIKRWVMASAAAACLALTADACVQLQYWKNSETLFRHATDTIPGNYEMLLNLANVIAVNPARFDEAEATYRDCLRINPTYANAHNNLGALLMKNPARVTEGIGEFREAIRDDPNFARAHFNLASALWAIPGLQEEGLEEYETAIRIEPQNSSAQRVLGVVLATLPGRLPDALDHFQEAVRLNPDDAEAQLNLGITLGRMGRDKDGLPYLEEAVRLDPNDAGSQMNLGVALSRIPGRMPEAIQHFEASLRLRPDPERRRKLDLLEAAHR